MKRILLFTLIFFTITLSFGLFSYALTNPGRNSDNLTPTVSVTPKILVISDINGNYGETVYSDRVLDAIERIVTLKPDLLIITGDLIAGQRRELNYHAMWDSFFSAVYNPIRRVGIPIAITPGNHDASPRYRFSYERAVFIEKWQQNKLALNFLDESNYPLYYSFSLGNILFISLDAADDGPISTTQRRWVEIQLRLYSTYKYKIVFGHYPLYSFTRDRRRDILNDGDLMEILKQNQVDIFLSGHHHAYYPGMVDGIHMVSQSNIGPNRRRLLGADRRFRRAITSIDFSSTGTGFTIRAFQGRSFSNDFDQQRLPSTLRYRSSDRTIDSTIHRNDTYRP